jgi:hypothetical protein
MILTPRSRANWGVRAAGYTVPDVPADSIRRRPPNSVQGSLFADGVTSEAFICYRKDVDHYKDWPLAKGQVWALNLFVDSFTPGLNPAMFADA